jgi:hypothetical protein
MTRTSQIVLMIAVLLLAVLALPVTTTHEAEASVPPSEVWVATTGSNSNPGTQAQPFATIQYGIDHVADDGTVHVAAGTYNGNLSIEDEQDLIGAGAQSTFIVGNGTGHVINISSGPFYNTISGFTIQNGSTLTVNLLNPADENVLYSGIKLPSVTILPQLFNAGGLGGGIYISNQHVVTLNDCVIKDNQADNGGGIYNNYNLYMYGCTVSGNSATQNGGGIYNRGTLYMSNCTISGNIATLGGGGIYNDMSDDISSWYSTIASNQATGAWSRGGGFNNVGPFIFRNTIVANNTAGDSAHNNGYNVTAQGGQTISLGYNLDSENSCEFDQPTDLVNTNPLLGPLQDNGGPTFTHALLHGSPAIDAGSCVVLLTKSNRVFAAVVVSSGTDQRGVPRPQGTSCDIGAYELAQDSANAATGAGTVYFSTLNGYITGLTALDESQTDCGPNPNFYFPYGTFSFHVADITPGSTVTIVIILPSNAPDTTQYWKCINGEWVDCTSLLGSNDGDQVLTLTITDGGLGDRDGEANGDISDPGGPTLVVSQAGPESSPTLPRLLNPPQMSVQYLSVNPQQATANQPVTISTNVVNTGDQGGNLNIALKINGQVEQTRMVSVGPQASQPVKFTITKSEPGTYSVDIGGQTGSFTIPDTGSHHAPTSAGLIAILVVGVLILTTVMVLVLGRRT